MVRVRVRRASPHDVRESRGTTRICRADDKLSYLGTETLGKNVIKLTLEHVGVQCRNRDYILCSSLNQVFKKLNSHFITE